MDVTVHVNGECWKIWKPFIKKELIKASNIVLIKDRNIHVYVVLKWSEILFFLWKQSFRNFFFKLDRTKQIKNENNFNYFGRKYVCEA